MKIVELDKFLSLIDSVLKQPAMTNINKVEDLDYLIKGYSYAIQDEHLIDFLDRFRAFVNVDVESKCNHSWTQLIRLYSSNDGHSLLLFQEMFNRFLERHPIETKAKASLPNI